MSEPQLRLDVLTIFPEYLDPLRHALLGKAIEQGILAVGVHNLRDWATGNHKSVDAPPLGGGPGMVMKPEVWGPALDDVAAGRTGHDLASAAPHRNDRPRHDDVGAVEPRPYAGPGGDGSKPLLLVPTPAGAPFTQANARAWSRERHIVVACGRYEGIDQRVFEDAAHRYRVREVSIGDYVLVGGEVAALVIAEAVTRLIPGVLGNTESHEEDSFSDGLLEGPSYTKPRTWRGLEAPEVLFSGDHARVNRWRRDQSLLRTRAVRPELLDNAELDADDLFTLHARPVRTEVKAHAEPPEWEKPLKVMQKKLSKAGYVPDATRGIHAQFMGGSWSFVIHGRTRLSLDEVERVVLATLPRGAIVLSCECREDAPAGGDGAGRV